MVERRRKHPALSLSWLLAAALGLSGCESDVVLGESAGACAPPVRLESARLRVDEGGLLRDELGREVIMRGLNTGGRSKFEPFLPFPIDTEAGLDALRLAADEYFRRLRWWGLDTARVPFSWEALEPERGQIDQGYLDRYEAMIDVAWARGVRVIVDFHQDIYASPFCGDGFPPWTIEDLDPGPPRHDCPAWFMSYYNDPGVNLAFDRFWRDEGGVQGAMREMWALVAGRLADHPGVVGFELINEPHAGSAQGELERWKAEVLEPFYETLAAEIQAIAPEALIFYDSTGFDAPNPADAIHPRPAGEGLVYAPHYYDGTILMGIGWQGDLPARHIEALASFRDDEGLALLLGEFGVPNGVEGGDQWLSLLMDALDEHRVSATLWEYSESDERWNDEDLSVVDADGSERAILDAYLRPWLRAIDGDQSELTWDAERGEVRARWVASGESVTELVLPPRLFPEGPAEVVVEGEGACHALDMSRGELRVAAPAGQEVTLRVR